MARIQFSSVYQVVEFMGRKRGTVRVGGYMPANWDKYSRIHTLSMPTFDFAVTKLLGRGVSPMRAYAVAGLFWAIVSKAANGIAPGLLVIRVDNVLRPMTDEELAADFGLTYAEWRDALPLLLPGTGAGLLETTTAAVEVELGPEEEKAQSAAVDCEQLPLFFDRLKSASSTLGTTKRNEVNERSKNETKRNERPAPSRAGGASPENGGNHKDEAGGGLSACLSFLSGGQIRQAQREFCGLMETLLPPRTGKDRAVLVQMFMRATTLADSYGAPPDVGLIGERLLAIARKAAEIVELARVRSGDADPIRNPLGVLIAWARKDNVRMLVARAK